MSFCTISKTQSDPSPLGYGLFFFKWSLSKYAIWIYVEKYLNIVIFFQNFPPIPEMISKIQSVPSPLGYGIFFFQWSLSKHAIWIYAEKYLNIVILFRISPGSRNNIAISIRPFSIGLRDFFQKWLCGFLKKVSPDVRVHFIGKHIRLNFGPNFRPLVSPRVRQSVSPSVRSPELTILFTTVPGFRACYLMLILFFLLCRYYCFFYLMLSLFLFFIFYN